MSCAVLANAEDTRACFFCDTADWAFGPVFYDEESATEQAETFRQSLPKDPRGYTPHDLEVLYETWRAGKE